VEVLPELTAASTNSVLTSAVNTLAVTLLSGGPVARTVSLSSAWESYSLALTSLRDELRSASGSPSRPSEIIGAIMCLLLSEIHLNTNLRSWTAHLEGFAQSVRLAGPQLFSSGVPHKLFVGACPLLVSFKRLGDITQLLVAHAGYWPQVVLSFFIRKKSFLDSDEWRRVPFAEVPPSLFHQLFGKALAIPTILEKIEEAATAPRESAVSTAEDSVRQLIAVLDALELWKDDFQGREASPPVFGGVVAERGSREWPPLWFQSITDCNAASHFWAFRAICLATIDQLDAEYPEIAFDRQRLATRMAAGSVFEEMRQLSTWICQCVGMAILSLTFPYPQTALKEE